jgi:hypothetical protein
VTVQNTPSGFGVGWSINKDSPGYVDCELRNVGQPGTGNENGKYYDAMTWDLPCDNASLTVKNARLEKVWPYIWGFVHLKVYNSNLADIGIYAATGNMYGPIATVEIYDSTIDEIFDNGGGRFYVEDSEVSNIIAVRDVGSVVYGYGVTGPYQLLKTGGGSYVPLDRPGPPW